MRTLLCLLSLAFLALPRLHGQGFPAPAVEVSPVESAPMELNRRYPGHLESPATVALVPRVSGELLEVKFTEGQVVEAGALLYRLEEVRYQALVKSAQASIARCQASLRYSKSNYDRTLGLYEKGVATLDAMEAARMAYETDQAALASAEAALVTAQEDLKNTRIYAPIQGKLGKTSQTAGNYLTAASGVLATLTQMDPLRLSFSMSTRDFLELFGNEETFRQEAIVRLRLADGSLYGQEGTFEFLDNQIQATTDTMTFFVRIPNPDAVLLPGASVTVLLSRRNPQTLCAVLPSALMADGKGSYVWVVDDANTAHRRDVRLGASDGRLQWLLQGVQPGEKVVTEGGHKIVMDGMAVKPVARQ